MFLLLHGMATVQAWDRYLLPLAPMLAWLWAGAGGGWCVAGVDAVARPLS